MLTGRSHRQLALRPHHVTWRAANLERRNMRERGKHTRWTSPATNQKFRILDALQYHCAVEHQAAKTAKSDTADTPAAPAIPGGTAHNDGVSHSRQPSLKPLVRQPHRPPRHPPAFCASCGHARHAKSAVLIAIDQLHLASPDIEMNSTPFVSSNQ